MGNWSVVGEWPQLSDHGGQEGFLDKPNNRIINAEIIMHDSVTETSDAVPINLRVDVFELLWKPVGSLANDLEVADYSIHSLTVFCNVLKSEAFCNSGSSQHCPKCRPQVAWDLV